MSRPREGPEGPRGTGDPRWPRWLRWLVPLAAAAGAALTGAMAPGEPPAASLEEHADGVADRVVERLDTDEVPGAAVAVVVDGTLAWARDSAWPTAARARR